MKHNILATGSDALDRIMAYKSEEVGFAKTKLSLTDMRCMADDRPPSLEFALALQESLDRGRSAVIAEIKKASPSKGVIREDFKPIEIARSYQEHGASCLSVLTDSEFFQGSVEIFEQVRGQCSIPMLRKDFMLDEYQIYQARAMQADCVLLIAAALDPSLMTDLCGLSMELGLDVLVEVHNERELEVGLALQQPMIGINNRNLQTFETSLESTLRLLPMIPNDTIVVTESGIHCHEDIEIMRNAGVNTFLVGEAFMRAPVPGEMLSNLFFSEAN